MKITKKPKRGWRGLRVAAACLVVVWLSLGAGCTPSVDWLDAHTEALIEQTRREQLGGDTAFDPAIVPPDPDSPLLHDRMGYNPYDRDIDTDNPAAGDLPVRPVRGEVDLENPPDLSREAGPAVHDPVRMDLQRAFAYALANSREYRNRREQLYIAALDLLIEKHLWGPRFFETFTTQVAGTPATGERDHALTVINEFQVTQRLPYGGDVSATALVNYVNQLQTAPGSSAESGQDAELALSIEQPLLRGFGIVAQEDLIQAQRNLVYAGRAFERFRRQFLVDVATSYFGLLLQQSQIQTQEVQVGNLRWLSRRMEALARAGFEPFFEVQRVQQQLLFNINSLLNQREGYRNQLDQFKLLIGMPVEQPLEILPTELIVPTPELEPVRAVELARKYRLDLQTAANVVEDAYRRTKVAKNQTLPDLDLFARAAFPTDSDQQYGGLGLSAAEGSYTAGLRFQTELPRQTEQIRYRQALIDLDRSRRAYALARDQVAQDVRRAVRAIQVNRYAMELQQYNIQIAERRFEEVTLKLRQLGTRDFIEAQQGLATARNQRDAAVRNLRVSILQYLLDSGQMRVTGEGGWQAPGTLGVPEKVPTMPRAPDVIQPENGEEELPKPTPPVPVEPEMGDAIPPVPGAQESEPLEPGNSGENG